MNKVFTIGSLLIMFLLFACKAERDPCLQPKQVNAQVLFKQRIDTGFAFADTILPNMHMVAIDDDSLKFTYYAAKGVSKVLMPLSNSLDSVRYILQADSSVFVRDTLTVFYTRQLHFISNACGYNYYYHLNKISSSHNAIDSLFIQDNEVTNDVQKEHIIILF